MLEAKFTSFFGLGVTAEVGMLLVLKLGCSNHDGVHAFQKGQGIDDCTNILDQERSFEAGQRGMLDQTLDEVFGENLDCVTDSSSTSLALFDDKDLAA